MSDHLGWAGRPASSWWSLTWKSRQVPASQSHPVGHYLGEAQPPVWWQPACGGGRPRSPMGGRWPYKMTQALQCRACASTVLWEKPVLGLMTTRERYKEPNRRFRLQHSMLFHHRTDNHLGTRSDTRLFPSKVLTTSLPLPPYVSQQEQTPNSQ